MGLPEDVRAWIEDRNLIRGRGRDRVGVAYSGGPDSLGLLCVLAESRIASLLVGLHVDHGLHDASATAADEALTLAARAGVAAVAVRVRVPADGHGVEAAARIARYAALEKLAADLSLDVVATAHTADDRAETLLLNLLRGAGLDGLSSLRPRRDMFVRPLLGVRRAAVRSWLDGRGLQPLADPANADPAFARNRLRADLVPVIERLAPGSVGRIAATADLLDDERALLDDLAGAETGHVVEVGPDRASLDLARLRELPAALARRVVRSALRPLLGGQPPSGAAVEVVLSGRGGSLAGSSLASRLEDGHVVVFTPPPRRSRPSPARGTLAPAGPDGVEDQP